MYTLPAAPPPDASVAAENPAALHRPGSPGAGAAEAADVPGVSADDDGAGTVDGAEDASWLAELVAVPVPVGVVVWACGWPGPHAVSNSAAAVAAVDMTNPWNIR